MTRLLQLMAFLAALAVTGGQEPKGTPPPSPIQLRMTTDKRQYKLGETIRVKVELFNSSKETILVGRDLSPIYNWPFNIALKLVNSSGKMAQATRAAFVDPPPIPDCSLRSGALRWWVALDPGYSYSKEISVPLQSVRPGNLKLLGEYESKGLPDNIRACGEQSEIRVTAFKGKVDGTGVDFEVVPN